MLSRFSYLVGRAIPPARSLTNVLVNRNQGKLSHIVRLRAPTGA